MNKFIKLQPDRKEIRKVVNFPNAKTEGQSQFTSGRQKRKPLLNLVVICQTAND